MNIIQNYVKSNPCYWNEGDFNGGKPQGLMLHSVGCAQSDAKVFNRTFNGDVGACVHAFIDANDGIVYQHLPWTHKAWHCAGSGNQTHIGVEMCESTYINYLYGATFSVTNLTKAQNNARVAYNSAVELFAMLCTKFGLNPLTQICSHNEGNKLGIASNHGDPEHYWKQLNMTYTMDRFRKDVKAQMGGGVESKPTITSNELYRVQLGAFAVKSNAENLLSTVKKDYKDAFVVKIDNYYKVQVGAFAIKTNAENFLKEVKKKSYAKDAFITTTKGVEVTTPKKSIEELAKEVIAGKWGAGDARKTALEKAGYDYNKVQAKVNELLG